MASLSFLIFSIDVLPRMTIEPLPVSKADLIPDLPIICAPVGKSGPGIISSKSSEDIEGSSIIAKQPSIISPKLCGGMLVAIPTAIPPAPLTNRLGYFAGKTVGSLVELS